MRIPVITAAALSAALAIPACSSDGCGSPDSTPLGAADSVLLQPASAAFQATPPDTFQVLLTTSEGPLTVQVVRAWAPLGAARFYNLVRNGFYDNSPFFRVVPGYVAQFGVHGHPAVDAAWAEQKLPDDPVVASNLQGTLAFAHSGPGTRVSQVFINYRDNQGLDQEGFAPFGRIVKDSAGALLKLYSLYGEPAPLGRGPSWECVVKGGNAYLQERYEQLDRVLGAQLVQP